MARTICVIGAGRWGGNHIKALAGLGCLGGIVDSRDTTLRKFQDAYPGVRTYQDVEDALAADFDGFVVATPATTHREIAARILSVRKPALVEKPLALTAAEARELAQLAANQDVALMVGHVLLFHPAIRKIQELVESGKIGKLQYLYSNRLNLGTVRTEENILWSFAPHDISIFQFLVGDDPIEVVSRGGAFLQGHIHDSTMTVLTYPRNVVGHIFVSWLHPYKEHRLVLIGSKGMLSFEDASENKELLFYEKGIDWIRGEPIKRDGLTERIPYDPAEPLTEELKYFMEHMDRAPIEIAGPRDATIVLDILERATESLFGGHAHQPTTRGRGSAAFIHPSSYVDDNVEIGRDTKIWHFSHIQSGTRIGAGCSIGQNVSIGNNVIIGDHVKIQNNVSVYEGVELEDYVFCGPSMVFTNVPDPRAKYPQRGSEHYRRTRVKEGASIGANATIVCGNTIGRHAFIGAGAVVTKDVVDYALMVGVPARRVGWVCECGEVLRRDGNSDAVACRRCALRYRTEGGRLVPGCPPGGAQRKRIDREKR